MFDLKVLEETADDDDQHEGKTIKVTSDWDSGGALPTPGHRAVYIQSPPARPRHASNLGPRPVPG